MFTEFLSLFLICSTTPGPKRTRMDLSGPWEIQAEGQREADHSLPEGIWNPIEVPSTWETALGEDFDGIAWYRKTFQVPALPEGNRFLLRFHAVATEAEVWVNSTRIGSHLGAWTPFTLDVTELLSPEESCTLLVRVDEKVGHNTQGFLPIIGPHFGGIWQPVELLCVGSTWIDDSRVQINASEIAQDGKRGVMRVSVPIQGATHRRMKMRLRMVQEGNFEEITIPVQEDVVSWTWETTPALWGMERPHLYDMDISLLSSDSVCLDEVRMPFGFRKAEGPWLLLNGDSVVVRGVLSWGTSPPSLCPSLDPERFREQVRLFRSQGFNLIKFCLWEPPEPILRVMDQEGMLAWIEYPTWHPKMNQAHKEELMREYGEMSNLDGNHPSVILRSLTCETGPSADVDVLTELYHLVKTRCPGTLVEDDSSWIQWNRVHDFWDDHPYGNLRAWRETLSRLQDHREGHGMKPLLLGEAIAADTWPESERLLQIEGSPWWTPNWLQDQVRFEKELRKRFGSPDYDPVKDLREISLSYAMDLRRGQIEIFREMLPDAGYVVSTLRDVKLCAMGLLDTFDEPKWTSEEWAWHQDILLSPGLPGDQRGIRPGKKSSLTPHLSVAGGTASPGVERIRWLLDDHRLASWSPEDASGGLARTIEAEPISLKMSHVKDDPAPKILRAEIELEDKTRRDISWRLWALPEPCALPPGILLYGEELKGLKDAFPEAVETPDGQSIPSSAPLVVARRLTSQILEYIEQGGRVLHIPSPLRGSFREEGLWFLRGTAWAPDAQNPFFERVPCRMLSDLHAYELQGNGVVRGERFWDQVDPWLAFIETHDLDRVRSNLLLFETGVGQGRMAVSCLRHEGGEEENYAGLWLAREIARYLIEGPPPSRSLDQETVSSLKRCLETETLKIETPWKFQTDPAGDGIERGCFRRNFDEAGWLDLKARSEEEGKIWDAYDGWGWYRQWIEIPADWSSKDVTLVFDSVDDMYELYVNGDRAGSYGKMDRSESSFLKRTWVNVKPFLKFGEKNLLVVRVYDWVGSGGLNGEVWLTTGSPKDSESLLRF